MTEEKKNKAAEKDMELLNEELENISGGVTFLGKKHWRCPQCGALNPKVASACTHCKASKPSDV